MKLSEIPRALERIWEAREAPYLVSPPGVGKTAIVRQTAAKLGKRFILVEASEYDETEAAGFGHFALKEVGGKEQYISEWCPPATFPLSRFGECEPTVLLFDDFAHASRGVQAIFARAFSQAASERRIGPNALADNVLVAATGNRQQDQAGAMDAPSYVRDRVVYLDVEHDIDAWWQWASAEKRIHPDFLAFLAPGGEGANGIGCNHLYDFEPAKAMRTGCTPRSLEKASKLWTAALAGGESEEFAVKLLKGTLCGGFSTEFLAFLKLRNDLPNLNNIWEGKPLKSYAFFNNSSLLHAAVNFIAATYTPEKKDFFFDFVLKLSEKKRVWSKHLVCLVLQRDKGLYATHSASFTKWATANRDLFEVS